MNQESPDSKAGERKRIFERSLETQLLTERLAKLDCGDEITYAQMNAAIGFGDVQKKERTSLSTARKNLLREGYVFATISSVGMRRLHPHEIALTTPSVIKKIARATEKHGCELGTADIASMSGDEQRRHGAAMLQTMLIASASNRSMQKRIGNIQEQQVRAGILDMDMVRRLYGA